MPVNARTRALYELVAPDAEFEAITDPVFRLTEGPLWNAEGGFLLFSDIPRDTIYRLDERGVEPWRRPSGNANGLTYDAHRRLLACESGQRRVTLTEPDGTVTALAHGHAGRSLNAPNDVVASSSGAVYFTDPSTTSRGRIEGDSLVNGLYLVRPGDREPTLLCDDFDLPNGLCLSPDESVLYVDDTMRREIRAFDVRAGGLLANERTFFAGIGEGLVDPDDPWGFGEGVPDGMKVDEHGNVYCTGPRGIWVVEPGGALLGTLELSSSEHARNVNWGGPDWRTLFVCAGSPVERRASVYRIELRVRGAGCYIH